MTDAGVGRAGSHASSDLLFLAGEMPGELPSQVETRLLHESPLA